MKITGRIDSRDRIAWINWTTDHAAYGHKKWKGHLFLWLGLAIPPIVYRISGESFHWGTYLGCIILWIFYFFAWRLVALIVQRRDAKRTYDLEFEMEEKNGLMRLHVGDRRFEYPVSKVSAISLASNLILTVDGYPFCVTPRNANIDGGMTIDSIMNMIRNPDPSAQVPPRI